ncbi:MULTISPECIES: phosphate ABC transporter permease subunit PstC [unclassified Paracoccus (in: a-proteobacteria)]|uniref:phosphate ABC transporter permease subunit PstC n=1 Tax=unclassified Paracoccus (in: a-proteobacteria) TaxID=2688777 RepID=UPI0012B19709|nr:MULTISPECIES: phosphate ABC transporter permease subunit PstC [unclassified Paracoccus (in: a-proteobacteria)]UXU74015.1 phosphate ABC transporter permease subunit PstC [Paracoccus sp. SMMA_5]UXU79903.1 phosphate ABC transporter permease subunit PstC [Paracoccus sp. SMMA_5_TC]
MPVLWTLLIVLILAIAGFFVTRARAVVLADGDTRRLHSRPGYYGWNAALLIAVPAFLVMAIWRFVQPAANGTLLALVAIGLALAGMVYAYGRTAPQYRARNAVETMVRGLLILCSSIAILTTLGIVLSMLFETGNFLKQYPLQDFLFGSTWSPKFGGGSQLGMLPLLWGTLYISAIALAVSVPIGLFAAIYLSEYASGRLRSIAKPAIEVLAGIPTIVYGLFALITVGPFLRDYFAQPLGLGSSGSSVMTAGLVMGIMLIPFVSSLSDDIINAVPQSLRDGALGLGSTHSETIRKVVLPAALPGIVGAVLLAASRAIGETMIVVLGAGAAAKLSMNPFEAMTTITVKIVSQLTGDTDFAAPETLVAFALGLTLFIITLGLNVIALYVVRKYREQYE